MSRDIVDSGARHVPGDRRWDRIAWAVILGGAALRVAWTLGVHPPVDHVFSDMRAYVNRANRLAEGHELSRYDAFYPPGTHVLLAIPLRIFGTGRGGLWAASVLWASLSGCIPYLGWRVARWFLSPRGAALAAGVIAVWPLSVTYGGYFLSETPTTVCLLLVVWLSLECRHARTGRGAVGLAGLWGLCAGVALAVRPQLALSVAIAGALVVVRPSHRRSVVLAAAAALALPVVATLALNTHAAGQLAGLSENGGFNFFQGHCVARDVVTGRPGNSLSFGSPVALQLDRGRSYEFPDNLAWEQSFFFDRGWSCIRHDGIGHVRVVAYNVLDLGFTTTPWPQSTEGGLHGLVDATNTMYGLVMLPVLVAALTGGFRRELILAAHLAAVIATALLFYGDPRFRIPSDALGIILTVVVIESALPRSDVRAVGGLEP